MADKTLEIRLEKDDSGCYWRVVELPLAPEWVVAKPKYRPAPLPRYPARRYHAVPSETDYRRPTPEQHARGLGKGAINTRLASPQYQYTATWVDADGHTRLDIRTASQSRQYQLARVMAAERAAVHEIERRRRNLQKERQQMALRAAKIIYLDVPDLRSGEPLRMLTVGGNT